MDTYPEWEAITLDYTYDYVDYIALHQYFGEQEKGTKHFLAQSLDMERYIQTVIGTADYIKAKKRSSKKLYISFDEWGVWSMSDTEVVAQVNQSPWQGAPAFSEQIYTMEDALLFASMLMNFLKYADRIKIACQSLLTNISAAIMTKKEGEVWVQPIYYPFAYTSRYGRGVVLESVIDSPTYECDLFAEVPYLDNVAVYNEEAGELVYFQVNRGEEDLELTSKIEDLEAECVIEHMMLYSDDKKSTNLVNHDLVKSCHADDVLLRNNVIQYALKPLSWNMVRIKVRKV